MPRLAPSQAPSQAPYRAPHFSLLARLLSPAVLLVGLGACTGQPTPAHLRADARQLSSAGDVRGAVIQLKNLIGQAPNDADARLALGRLYLDSGDLGSADKELRRALALGKPAADVLPWLGQALLLQGLYDQLLAELPDDAAQPRLLALRGHALLGLQQSDAAQAVFARILVQHAAHPAGLLGQARLALLAGRHDQALALTARVLALPLPAHDGADAWRLRGDLLRLAPPVQASVAAAPRAPGAKAAAPLSQAGTTQAQALALQAYRQALALQPTRVQLHVDIANLHIQSGQYDAARAELAIARRVAPNNLMLYYTQALLDFRENRYTAARDQLQQVLRAAPEHLPSHLLMGVVMRKIGATTQAEQHLRRFLAAQPGHRYASKLLAAVLLQRGDIQAAQAQLAPLLARPGHRDDDTHRDSNGTDNRHDSADPDGNDSELLALAGELAMRARRYDEAAKLFERASALAPQTPMLRAALAMSHLGLGEQYQAVAELERAAGADNGSVRAGVLLVLTHLHSKQYGDALIAVRRLTRAQPENPMLRNLEGGVLLMQRDKAGARASFQQALRADPLFLPAHDNLTRLDLAANQPAAAQKRLEAALRQVPDRADLLVALADLALHQGQAGQALGWLERARRAHPDDSEAALRLAAHHARQGELPAALSIVRQLAASHAEEPRVWRALAPLQARSGLRDEAVASWRRLAELQPGAVDVHLQLASAREANGDADGARQSLGRALQLAPGHAQAQSALVKSLIASRAWPQALQAVRGFQAAQPGSGLAHKLEGDILLAQQRHDAAVAAYEAAYKAQPAAANLIALYSALVQTGKAAAAHARMAQWLDRHPAERSTRLFFANSLLAERAFAASAAQFEALLAQAPDEALLLNNLAWLYQQLHDPRALATAERAYERAPDHPVTLDTLGWILTEADQPQRALPLLQRAHALAPANGNVRYHLGVALGRTGDTVAGRRHLQALLVDGQFAQKAAVRAQLAQW